MRPQAAALFSLFLLCGCNAPRIHTAPKSIEADGTIYLACEGFVKVYSPSRDIIDSSGKSYEVVFTDGYGKEEDIKDIKFFSIEDAPGAHYPMPPEATPDNMTTTYSNGTPLIAGNIVYFGETDKGDRGRAFRNGPGKWSAVPCQAPLQ